MKNRKLLIAILAGVVVCAAVMAFLAIPGLSVDAKPKGLVGAWDVNIHIVDVDASFPGLISFFSDGNILADEAPSIQETSGHGSWVSTGENRGAYTFVFLVIDDTTGSIITGTVSGNYKYDPKTDQWHGTFTINQVDQDGNPYFSDHGTMDGRRIQAAP